MARRDCSQQRLFNMVVFGLFFLTTHVLPFCSCAVDICPPCGPGEFCSTFFGTCLPCDDYCTTTSCRQEHKECNQKRLYETTVLSTTTVPASSPGLTTFQAMNSMSAGATASVVTSSHKIDISSGGRGNNTSPSGEYLNLPEWLFFVLLIALALVAIFGWYCLKYRKALKSSWCCFRGASQTGEDIELQEHTRNRRRSSETTVNIRLNLLENPTPVRPSAVTGYTAVQVEDEDDTGDLNQPGPSGQNFSRSKRHTAVPARPFKPERTADGVRSKPTLVKSDPPFQSATIHLAPPLEQERSQRATPVDHQLPHQKTPEIHRKITDGTLEGHEYTTGASSFTLPRHMREDLRLNHGSGHGD